jgi:hypothetical protein
MPKNNFTSPTYFLANIFDMLEDPGFHVKTQNASIKGCKHQKKKIICFGVKILPKYSQNIRNLVEFTFETKKIVEFSPPFLLKKKKCHPKIH